MVRGKAEEVTFCTNLRGVRCVRKRGMLLTSLTSVRGTNTSGPLSGRSQAVYADVRYIDDVMHFQAT